MDRNFCRHVSNAFSLSLRPLIIVLYTGGLSSSFHGNPGTINYMAVASSSFPSISTFAAMMAFVVSSRLLSLD